MAPKRSRNYPAFGLAEAIERARALYSQEGTAQIPRDIAVKSWGYNSLNGASARTLGALRQFGLLDDGPESTVKLSSPALAILLEPETSEERQEAIAAAARTPAVFSEVLAIYGDTLPSDAALVSHLVRKEGFGENAAKKLVAALRDTMELVDRQTKSYTSPMERESHVVPDRNRSAADTLDIDPSASWTKKFSWSLSDGTVASLVVSGEPPSEDDLAFLDTCLKRARNAIADDVKKLEGGKLEGKKGGRPAGLLAVTE